MPPGPHGRPEFCQLIRVTSRSHSLPPRTLSLLVVNGGRWQYLGTRLVVMTEEGVLLASSGHRSRGSRHPPAQRIVPTAKASLAQSIKCCS